MNKRQNQKLIKNKKTLAIILIVFIISFIILRFFVDRFNFTLITIVYFFIGLFFVLYLKFIDKE
jgi:hypothetical protein